ncbi:diacylglycerol O-acyltransferase 1-like isoform X1 [Mytilus edulis]
MLIEEECSQTVKAASAADSNSFMDSVNHESLRKRKTDVNKNKSSEKETNNNHDNIKNKKEHCESCLKEQKVTSENHTERRRSSLMESIDWFKRTLSEPEFIMYGNNEKSKGEIHKHADSLLSTASGFTNYRGLLNLCILLLALANTRLFLENILKYGILIDPVKIIHLLISEPYSWPNVILILGSNIFALVALFNEKLLAKGWLSENTGFGITVVNLVLCLLIPSTVILVLHPNPIFSCITCGMYSVMFLKLVSYFSVNRWCRLQRTENTKIKRRKSLSVSESMLKSENGKPETMLVSYPDNLNYTDLYYFLCAPTLCYELNFPRSLRIRKRFLLKRAIEMIFLSQLIMALIQQWIIPTVNNSMKPLSELEFPRMVERLLKLAVPNHIIWLIFFYCFFHSSLNVIAEILRFGDREFYKDWWNSETVDKFWKTWNVPVHRWCVRHLFKPLVKRGYSKMFASVAVFALSAFFHEFIVSVPLRMFRVWAFSAMLGQVPFSLFVNKYCRHEKYGNMAVWLSLILGQPIAIFAYVHDYYIIHYAAPT